MALDNDKYTDPITLEYIQLTYEEVAKTLFIDYANVDESIKALACLEFIKHYFFNTSDAEVELFKKRNPSAGMLYDILDGKTASRQNSARWSSWTGIYGCDESKTIEDVLEEKRAAKRASKKEQNRKSYLKRKAKKDTLIGSVEREQMLAEQKRIQNEVIAGLLNDINKDDC